MSSDEPHASSAHPDTLADQTELQAAMRALRESEERLAYALDASTDGLWDWDLPSGRLTLNARWSTMLGYAPDELPPHIDTWQQLTHPDDVPIAYAQLEEHAAGTRPQVEFEMRMRRKDGTWLWILNRAKIVARDAAGAPLRVVGTHTDIHVRKLQEEALRAAEAAEARRLVQQGQAQKLESIGLLAGGIAHDFNNLLVGILGNASLAEEMLPAASPARELIMDVRLAATRAADLTRQLLAYAGKGRLVVESVDVSVLVGELAALLRSAVSRRAVLRHELAPDLPGVRADATQLRQVVMNLITNASDALGDKPGEIVLRTFQHEPDAAERASVVGGSPLGPGRYVCIEVDDTGVGMHAATVQRIFDPFFTTKPSGHGLGLAAALGIVRGHGGAVRVESVEGRGTSVRVYLPVSVEDVVPVAAPPAAETAPGHARGELLIADDEPGVLAVARRTLERAGFTVVTCADGADAVELFRAAPARWRAVLLDVTMPVMGGQEALLAMRAIRSDVPAVLMSGYASEGLRPEVTALAGVAYVQKPFVPEGLKRAVLEVSAERVE